MAQARKQSQVHGSGPSSGRLMALTLLEPPLYIRGSSGRFHRRYKPAPGVVARMRREVYARDLFTCQGEGCGLRWEPHPEWDGKKYWLEPLDGQIGQLTLGHIVPYKHGGPFVFENLRAECWPCNIARGSEMDGVALGTA